MNKIFLIGNLTRDPEHRVTTSGISVCTFSLAVNRRFSSQDGKREADFISIVAWRGLADTCIKFLRKGSQVAVCGSLQTRTYEKDGVKRYVSEVVADEVEFLNRVGSSGDRQDDFSQDVNPFADISPSEDEVPF